MSYVGAALPDDQTEHPTKHERIQCMKDFRIILFGAERYYVRQNSAATVEEPIRVALIDDGVDFKDLECKFICRRTHILHAQRG